MSLKKTIDMMVEDAIRRILPAVMNEVLVATIARGTAGVVAESAPRRPRGPYKKRKQPERQAPSNRPKKAPPSKRRLDELLSLDDSAGAEFYQGSGSRNLPEPDEPDESDPPQLQRIQALAPQLQQLAEDIDMDDDGGEMWNEGEHDSASLASVPRAAEVRNIDEAARRAGIDFSRMKGVISATSNVKKVDRDDLKANAQFEQARLKRMREQLNGGKPVE